MTISRPDFEKKEMAISSFPYAYLPVDIPCYTVEITHRDPVDGGLLQRALERTIQRMPYLTDTLVIDHGAIYYAKNPLPMEVAHVAGLRHVGGSDSSLKVLSTERQNIPVLPFFFCINLCTQPIRAFLKHAESHKSFFSFLSGHLTRFPFPECRTCPFLPPQRKE